MRENDQNRWEYEVQQWQERQQFKRNLKDGMLWGLLMTVFLSIMFLALAA